MAGASTSRLWDASPAIGLLAVLTPGVAQAQLREMRQTIFGMD
jgi:hypothetical protein